MKRYPGYKDSGVDWIGKIPTHWDKSKIKYNTYVKGRIGWQGLTTNEYIDEGPFLVTGTDFRNGIVDWKNCYHVSEDRYTQDQFIQLQENDLLITKDGTIGKIALVAGLRGKATLNSGVFVTRPRDGAYINDFMYWALNSKIFDEYIEFIKSGTTISHLYQNTFVEFVYPLPPRDEQDKIIRFLNHKTNLIDNLIEKKQKQIELLQEQRSAIIDHAVTKGLIPNVTMKDTGIEWLGKISKHWELLKIAYISKKITNGYVGPTRDILKSEGTPYIQSLHVKENTIKFNTPYYVSKEWSNNHERSILKTNDILIVQTGAMTGEVGIVPNEFSGANCHALIILSPNSEKVLGEFLLYTLISNYGYNTLMSIRTGALHPHLNSTYVRDVYVPVPPLNEQKKIVNYVKINLNNFDTTVKKIQNNIDNLKEYRTAIISEVVTGKIDVRDEAIP